MTPPCRLLIAIALASLAGLAAMATRVPGFPAPSPRGGPAPDPRGPSPSGRIGLLFSLEPPLPPPRSPFPGPGPGELDRDWSRLDPEFSRGLRQVMAGAEARGFPLLLVEGYRSPDRQDGLAAQGQQVTAAQAWQSLHQFGLAADLAPLRDGRPVFSAEDPWSREAYRILGEEAEAAGFRWGGRWTSRDLGHVEAARRRLLAAR